MLLWPWISFDRDIYWRWILRKSSSQCHNNPVLVPPSKPPDPVKYLYDGQNYDLKMTVDIWRRMDVVPLYYGTLAQTFHLVMWFFHNITGIAYKWDYVMWRIISLLFLIGLLKKLISYRVPPDRRWELPVLYHHEIMVIYPYPFWVVITQLFSWIILINDCICILTGSPR